MKKIFIIICALFAPIMVFAKESPFYEKFQTSSYLTIDQMPYQTQTIEMSKVN